MSKMNQKIKHKWLRALRSGEFVQGRRFLTARNADQPLSAENPNKYCCLGVLCELAVQDGIISKAEELIGTGQIGNDTHTELIATNYDAEEEQQLRVLPQAVQEWAGLPNFSPYIEYNYDLQSQTPLAVLNDHVRLSFAEIADLIEEQL